MLFGNSNWGVRTWRVSFNSSTEMACEVSSSRNMPLPSYISSPEMHPQRKTALPNPFAMPNFPFSHGVVEEFFCWEPPGLAQGSPGPFSPEPRESPKRVRKSVPGPPVLECPKVPKECALESEKSLKTQLRTLVGLFSDSRAHSFGTLGHPGSGGRRDTLFGLFGVPNFCFNSYSSKAKAWLTIIEQVASRCSKKAFLLGTRQQKMTKKGSIPMRCKASHSQKILWGFFFLFGKFHFPFTKTLWRSYFF